MIENAYLESDEGSWVLVLEDVNGTHLFPCDPQLIEDALKPWRLHELEGEIVRREYVAAGRPSWDEYVRAQARTDPEFAEIALEGADLARKMIREGAMVDPGDESDAV